MSVTLRGRAQLERRLQALADTRKLLRTFAPLGLRHIKIQTPRKTGNLSRLNSIESVTDTEVRYANRAKYAVPVHEGSAPHDIRPVRRKALRFAPGASGRRLTGTPRTGAQVVFAKRVRHPGSKPNRFMARGLRAAMDEFSFGRIVVKTWDDAA